MPASTKKQVNRYFNGAPTSRLIVTVENDLVDKVDSMIKRRGGDYSHPCYGNRAEFVRQAIAEKLARDIT
jgi:metal-responsive CopG/Arc/MetJ family transcriptional regulator